MTRPIYVLGTGLSHQGSAILLKDGIVVQGIEKERITRRKRDGGNDTEAVRYCLEAEGIGLNDLDLVVQCANFEIPDPARYHGPRLFGGFDGERFRSISHHLAHAHAAAGACPLDDCGVLVIDGCGSPHSQCVDLSADGPAAGLPLEANPGLLLEKDSFYHFDGRTLAPLWKDFSPFVRPDADPHLRLPTTEHSIGGFYSAVSDYCLGDPDAAGKLMGLAPYGRRGAIDAKAFDLRDGRSFVRNEWRDLLRQPNRDPTDFKTRFRHYADVAAWAQEQVEEAILHIIRDRLERFPHQNLCYTGGVALNAVANARILKEGLTANLFVEPAAGDHGLALGCAYHGWLEILGMPRIIPDGSTCFGRKYSATHISREIERIAMPAMRRISCTSEEELVLETASLLAGGLVIGWFQGGSEFGPRALGRRSILASPFTRGVRDFINLEVKFREDFRPFAPAVLEEDASRYFVHAWHSPYMILVDEVKPEWREPLAEVSHLDGSARAQTVTRPWNPRFHALLRRMRELTGNSILLNTSFNRRGMPLVETPENAIDLFFECGLDALVIGDEILLKPRDGKAVRGRSEAADPAPFTV